MSVDEKTLYTDFKGNELVLVVFICRFVVNVITNNIRSKGCLSASSSLLDLQFCIVFRGRYVVEDGSLSRIRQRIEEDIVRVLI